MVLETVTGEAGGYESIVVGPNGAIVVSHRIEARFGHCEGCALPTQKRIVPPSAQQRCGKPLPLRQYPV
jgi:hypothetical protein